MIEFFGDIKVEEDNINLEQRFGRKTGTGLVFLDSEDDVQKARDELNRQYIGSRYVDVLIPRIETGDE